MTKADPPLVVLTRPSDTGRSYTAQTVYRGRTYTCTRVRRKAAVQAVTRTVLRAIH